MKVSALFDNPEDQAERDEEERRKRLMAAARVGSPGPISTMMGYSGNPLNNNNNMS